MKLTGDQLATLSEKFAHGIYLTDEELKQIIEGMEFLIGFLRGVKLVPIASYYARDLESLRRIQEARKVR